MTNPSQFNFWTSNTNVIDQNLAWNCYMSAGKNERFRSKNGDSLGVWAVRGGQIN